VADETARLVVHLDDETSGAANAAAGSLEKLRTKIEEDQKALKALEGAMRSVNKGNVVDIQTHKNLTAQIQAKRQAISASTQDYLSLGGTFNKIKHPIQEHEGALEHHAVSMRKFAGAAKHLGAVGGAHGLKVAHAFEIMGEAGGGMIAMLGGAIVAMGLFELALKGLETGFEMVKFAVEASEQFKELAESFEVAAQASGKLKNGSGDAALDMVVELAARTPLAREGVAKLTQEMLKAGVAGGRLETAVEALAIAEGVGAGGDKLVAQLKAAAAAGQPIDKLADKIKEKYGEIADEKMHSMAVQTAKAKENLVTLFAGVKTEGLLKGFEGILKMLDSSTVEGKALKALIETMLNPILEGVGSAGPAVKKFFQGMIIGALTVGIWVGVIKKKLEGLAGSKIGLGDIDWTTVGEGVMMVAIGVGLLAAAMGAAIGFIVLMTAGVIALAGALVGGFAFAVAGVVGFTLAIIGAVVTMYNYLKAKFDLAVDMGAQFALGIANGIRSGLSEVIGAAKEVAQGAVDSVKNVLKMHSPSKVGEDIADNFTGSIGDTMGGNTSEVKSRAGQLGEAMVPQGGALPAAGGVGAGSGGFVIEHLEVHGVEGADDPSFPAKLSEALQRALAMQGVAA
jgi:hypothetical protein